MGSLVLRPPTGSFRRERWAWRRSQSERDLWTDRRQRCLPGELLRSKPSGFTGQLIVYAGNGFNYISAEPLVPKLFGPGAGLGVQLYGGSANDVLVGGTAGDLLVGGGGDDILRGGSGTIDGNDTLDGGAGNDILLGHLGADVLRGGSGQDLLIAGQTFFVNAYQPGKIFDFQREWLSNRTYHRR